MAAGTVAVFFGNRFGDYRLRRYYRGIIEDCLAHAHSQIRLPFFHAGKIFSPMDLVDEILKIEILAGLRVDQLRCMTKRAVDCFNARATVGLEGIVAVCKWRFRRVNDWLEFFRLRGQTGKRDWPRIFDSLPTFLRPQRGSLWNRNWRAAPLW